jgi:hypothetical protein
MQIIEMYQLTQWVKTEITEAQIIQKFTALLDILNANANRPNNQQAQPFEEPKNDLLSAITSINLNILTLSQIHTLEIIGVKNNIGRAGKNHINEILSNSLDIAHVSQQITVMQSEIQQGVQKLNELEASLLPFIEEEEHELAPDQVLTRVIFEHDASVKNINELKDWSFKWFEIGRGFAIANGQTPEDIKVIGGARGSLILELALLATTALPIGKAINLTLDSMVKYKDFQIKAFEVRQLKDTNPKLVEEFEEDAIRWENRAKLLKKEIAEEIAGDLPQYFSDYREENQAELSKAVKTLVDFISKGGDVDCVISEETSDDESSDEITETMRLLKVDFSDIRKLKETLLLEHKDIDKE